MYQLPEMEMRLAAFVFALMSTSLLTPVALAAPEWVEGTNYFEIPYARPQSTADGKTVVTEVFSYACPACNLFYPVADRLQATLPSNAVLQFVPAAFRADEDWPMFQRAYYTAEAMGIDKRTHDAMFDAVWKTGELAITDPSGRRLKQTMPTIEDAAKFYAAKTGIKPEAFVAMSKSFTVDRKIREAEAFIVNNKVDSTPTIIVAGRYKLDPRSAGGADKTADLVKWLVEKSSK